MVGDPEVIWRPQEGPQDALIKCPYAEILFGGARGGGKTDGILGKYAIKESRFGEDFNAIFFRREMPQTDDLIERSKAIYCPIGGEWREQTKMFRMPHGGRIRFRPLYNVVDAQKFQGQNLCVAADTRIVMADGSLVAIGEINVGDSVATLEGPRPVTAKVTPYVAPCVSVQVYNAAGVYIGEQRHPIWHPVLTPAGVWSAYAGEVGQPVMVSYSVVLHAPGQLNPASMPAWVHPYSGEARGFREPIAFGRMEVRPCGDLLVADLRVDGANHYVGETGLVNKNTDVAVEEAGNYPDPAPIDMIFGALRSTAGVPIQLILSANPGGPGQSWIKKRYIDPAPNGNRPLRRMLPGDVLSHEYIYIPSKVRDNKLLLTLDPGYIDRLRLVGSPELVRAWLEGDWSVVAGAYFPEFSLAKHVIPPRELPNYWTRIRAFDWGSARPFSVGWWAVSDGQLSDIPRDALVRYREWYGASGPNDGLRLTAEEVADGIRSRESEKSIYGVADPAIFSNDGGPSISERMATRGVFFTPADNKRVGTLGRIGGWDQVRARLKGEDGKPALFIFATCTDLIRTIPQMQHDHMRPEDLDTNGEDHAVDEMRYACMSRPYQAPLPRINQSTTYNTPRGRGSAWSA